jgi:adenylate cyclase
VSGDFKTGLELARQALAIAQTAQETDWLLEAYRAMGGPLFSLGRLREAQAFFEQGATLYDPAEHERHAYRFGHDPAVVFGGYLSLTLWLLGYADQSAAQDQRLCDLIRSFSHPSSLAYAHCWLAKGACARRDAQVARRHAEEAIRLGQSYELPSWTALATALRGWALVEQGQAMQGLAQLSQGITAWRARGFEHFVPFFLALQVESCLKTYKLEEAVAAIGVARTAVQYGGDRYWAAELSRLQGDVAKAQGKDDREVEALFREALETARQQEARMLELRAAVSLARLWQSQGKHQIAREMLAEVYDRFNEGFDSHDLQTASGLLRTLL